MELIFAKLHIGKGLLNIGVRDGTLLREIELRWKCGEDFPADWRSMIEGELEYQRSNKSRFFR